MSELNFSTFSVFSSTYFRIPKAKFTLAIRLYYTSRELEVKSQLLQRGAMLDVVQDQSIIIKMKLICLI